MVYTSVRLAPHVDIVISEWKFHTSLFLMDIEDDDLILGMYWLYEHHVVVDYRNKRVTISLPGQEPLVIHKLKKDNRNMLIVRIHQHLEQNRSSFLSYVSESEPKGKNPQDLMLSLSILTFSLMSYMDCHLKGR